MLRRFHWTTFDLNGRLPAGWQRDIRAVAADAAYGDQDGFRAQLWRAGAPFVMALKPSRGMWAPAPAIHTPPEAARALTWNGPDEPGEWQRIERTFRDGHTGTWYAGDATLGGWGPHERMRLVTGTRDPATLPDKATWYLATNLPRPGSPHGQSCGHPAADLAEVVRIYGIRNWIEQGYKQVKDQLGWADFQVRSDIAIRRHQTLVNCAFSFCWQAYPPPPAEPQNPGTPESDTAPGERGPDTGHTGAHRLLARSAANRARLADSLDHAATLVAGMVERATTPAATSPDEIRRSRTRPAPLPPN